MSEPIENQMSDKTRDFESFNDSVTLKAGGASVLASIDQYELLKELGGGSFGTVYLARDKVAGIEVAVKGLPPDIRDNKEELENIRANFALVSRLHHPNIAAALVLHPAREVSIQDPVVSGKLRVAPGDTLMVMEYAPGVTLSAWRKQFPGETVPGDKALEIVRQLADALDYAHARKIIHRDIKPANVMVETSADGVVTARILDFGLAAEVHSSASCLSQQVTDTSGTRRYMAPEQWLGEGQGPATDQYSLAVLYHELVTGHVPFESVFETGDSVAMMVAVSRKNPSLDPSLSRRMRQVLHRALRKNPANRFPTCASFVRNLKWDMRSLRRVAFVGASLLGAALLVALLSKSGSPTSVESADVTPEEEPAPVAPVKPNYWNEIEEVPVGPAPNPVSPESVLQPLTAGCTVCIGDSLDGAVHRPVLGIAHLRRIVDEAVRSKVGCVVFCPAEACAQKRVSVDGYAHAIGESFDRLHDAGIARVYRRSDSPSPDVLALDDAAERVCRLKPVSSVR